MKLLVSGFVMLGAFAHADQIVDLETSEVQAANFIAQCAHEIANGSFLVEKGHRGTFVQGLLYSFDLRSKNGDVTTLEVKWDKDTGIYSCKLF